MPRDGSLVLSDVRGPTLTIVCAACGPRGRYNIEGLMTEHGDAKVCDVGYSRAQWSTRVARNRYYYLYV
jgi:hypothetical protein